MVYDSLLGLTLALLRYSFWAHGNKVGWLGFKVLPALGRAWKSALAQSDKTLGIDDPFTRSANSPPQPSASGLIRLPSQSPGTEALLEDLEEELDEIGADEGTVISFDWR